MESITRAEASKENSKNVSFKKLGILKGHKDIVQSMKILKTGQLVSGSDDTTVGIWSEEENHTKHSNGGIGALNSVEKLTDGRIAYCSSGDTINFWDYKNGTCSTLHNLKKERPYTNFIIQLSSGGIAFSTLMRCIKIWDIDKDVCLKTIDQGLHDAWISSLIELKNSELLATSSWDKTIKIWDISQDKSTCIKTLKGHSRCINKIRKLNDQMLVSAADDKTIMIWNINSNDKKTTLCGHCDKVYALLIVNEKIISGSRDKTVKIWDPKSENCIITIPCNDKVYSLEFSENNQLLFVGLGCGDIEIFQIPLLDQSLSGCRSFNESVDKDL